MDSLPSSPIQGLRIVNLGLNAPGPVAAARLTKLGAHVTKVEPPAGDTMKRFAAQWYDELTAGQTVIALDLKTDADNAKLHDLLDQTDLLLASFRPSALKRLGLDWESLNRKHPGLCFVGIIGYHPPDEEHSGHDLTYQAGLGLLRPPQLPATIAVDLAGAERAVSLSLALLLQYSKTSKAGCAWVSLHECARELSEPLAAGLTAGGGVLGGGSPFYSLYEASDGWIALAALEPHFATQLIAELGLHSGERSALAEAFRTRTAAEWEAWAKQHQLPLAAVRT